MIAFNRHILGLLDIVHTLQNGQTMPYTGNAHTLEVVML